MKKKVLIQQLMEKYKMTIHELIEMIKLKGEALEFVDSVFSVANDKYGERSIILFEGSYFVTCAILDSYIDKFYYENIEGYDEETQARVAYDELLIEHQGTV